MNEPINEGYIVDVFDTESVIVDALYRGHNYL